MAYTHPFAFGSATQPPPSLGLLFAPPPATPTPTPTGTDFGTGLRAIIPPTATPVTPAKPIVALKDLRKPHQDVPNYQGFVQVAVGKEQHLQVFDVHEYLITARSPFFRKVMSGNWQEAKDRLVKLPEDDPAIFQLYVHLLYTNMLAVIPNPGLAKDDSMEEVSRLAKLYVLAEKLQDIETKDLVVEAMLLGSREIRKDGQCYAPGPEAVGAIYAGTMPGSPMRRLYVDIYTYRANSIWLSKNSGDWPSEFVHELALELLDKRKTSADPTKTADLSSYKELRSAAAP